MLCSLYLRHLWRLSVRVTNPSTASSPNCCFSDRGWAKRLQGEELSLSISTSKDHSTSNTLWSAFSTTMLFIKIRKSMCVSLKFLIWLHIQQQHKQSVLWLYPQGNKRVLTTIPCCSADSCLSLYVDPWKKVSWWLLEPFIPQGSWGSYWRKEGGW